MLVLATQVRRRHAATLGMHLETAQQGRGLGARLLAETVAFADRLGLSRVALDVFGDNERALRLYERAGFVREGTRRMPCFRDGALVDDLGMARVRE